jgi:TonB family protein
MKTVLRILVCALLVLFVCLGSLLSGAAQKRKRNVRRQSARKSAAAQKQIVTQSVSDECVSDEEVEGCIIDPNAPQPNIGKSPKGVIISDCMPISGEIISRPKVCYPNLAKAARISGLVKVEVVVDEEGKVIWARVRNGHPLLQAVALRVACQTRMKPLVDCTGRRAKTGGILYYNFKLP